LRIADDRLVKWVVVESVKMAEKIGWLVDLEHGFEGLVMDIRRTETPHGER